MAMKSLSLFMLFAFFAASSLFSVSIAYGVRKSIYTNVMAVEAPSPDYDVVFEASAPNASPADLGFIPLNTKDPKVVELAKFALDDINKESKLNLTMESVLEAINYTHDVKVPTYGLVILTNNGTDLNAYSADVVVDKNIMKVTRFYSCVYMEYWDKFYFTVLVMDK